MARQLVSKKENGLEVELATAKVEQVLERRAEKVEDHSIIIAFGTEPSDERNTYTPRQGLVNLRFILKLRMLGFDGF